LLAIIGKVRGKTNLYTDEMFFVKVQVTEAVNDFALTANAKGRELKWAIQVVARSHLYIRLHERFAQLKSQFEGTQGMEVQGFNFGPLKHILRDYESAQVLLLVALEFALVWQTPPALPRAQPPQPETLTGCPIPA
jgi:hypothetical protein